MVVRVQIDTDADGLVVRKWTDAVGADELRLEGERLRTAAHPGVVELLASSAVDGGWELSTRHGGAPLRAMASLTVEQVARVGAAVAATLAALHERGVVHGRLDKDRILWGEHNPLLCGLGAGPVESTTADDVAALGAVVRDLAAAAGGTERGQASARRALEVIADSACDPVAERRPSAARFAAQLAGFPMDPPRRADRKRSVAVVVGMGTAAALLVVAAGGRGGGGTGPAASTSVALVEGRPACVAVAGAPARRPECSTTAEVHGGVVVIGGQRATVAQVGDEVAIGDWDCDGSPTAAVLRPATGEVLEFGAIEEDLAVSVVRAVHIDGAARLAIGGDEDCPILAVATDDGTVLPVEVASLP